MQLELRIAVEDVEAIQRLTDRLGQALKHASWALAEYRKELAARPSSDAEPIPPEDRTL